MVLRHQAVKTTRGVDALDDRGSARARAPNFRGCELLTDYRAYDPRGYDPRQVARTVVGGAGGGQDCSRQRDRGWGIPVIQTVLNELVTPTRRYKLSFPLRTPEAVTVRVGRVSPAILRAPLSAQSKRANPPVPTLSARARPPARAIRASGQKMPSTAIASRAMPDRRGQPRIGASQRAVRVRRSACARRAGRPRPRARCPLPRGLPVASRAAGSRSDGAPCAGRPLGRPAPPRLEHDFRRVLEIFEVELFHLGREALVLDHAIELVVPDPARDVEIARATRAQRPSATAVFA